MAEKVEPQKDWTEAEQWAWEQLQAGEVADFNAKLGETADPAKSEDWDARRTLRRQFLEAIIEEPWLSAIHRKGIRIGGAMVPADGGLSLDWERADLPLEVQFYGSRFMSIVNFCDAKISGSLSLQGSRLCDVDIENISIGKHLLLSDKAWIGGGLNLVGASIGGRLDTFGSRFEGRVVAEHLKVGQGLFLRNVKKFAGPINLIYAEITGTLELSESRFESAVNCTGVQVHGEFRLATNHFGRRMPNWGDKAELLLRNARIDTLQDRWDDNIDGWPCSLDLHGCQIGQLGGLDGDGDAANMLRRPVQWWIDWLRRGTAEEYSPQPYQMLAKLFREAGYPVKANAILYAARCREMVETENPLHRLWLGFLWITMGFGIGRYFARNVAGWLAFWTTAGTAALDFPSKAPLPTEDYLWKIAASIDRLIPFVEMVPRLNFILSESLSTGQTVYFAIHSLFGWMLAALVVAGLAGLTQKA